MFKKILNFLLLSSIVSAIFMLFFACSVGLGESVDTEVPKIEITYPPASSPVRDWFYLAGTASDDKGVASVSVSAENISTNEITDLGTFTPEKDGTWAVKINEKDSAENYKLKDGTYTFCIIAKDTSSQKSAPAYRTIEVDNTPPVFVIKNPGTIKAGKPSAFGSILKIVGAAADDHDIYELSLAVYDNPAMEGEPKAVISEKNVDKTDGINVTLARYNLAVDSGAAVDELHNNYLKIYDAAGGGNQNFFASVTLKDSAGVWQDYTKNQPSSVGNSTNGGLYLNDSVYETLMGKKSKYGLSAADFMRLLNGTYKNTAVSASSEERTAAATQASLDDEAKKEILKILGERKTETSKTPLAFSLNKNANPTYTVMGFSFDSSAESIANLGGHKAAKQNSLTFKAQAGLDGAYVKPTTLKIYLFGPYENGFCTAEKLEEIYSDPDLFYEKSIKPAKESAKAANGGTEPSEELVAGFAKAQILKDYSSSGASTAETFSESIELHSFITKGKYYLLAATGEDEDGVKLMTWYYYGFVGESAGTPPAVSITGFADGVMKNSVSKIEVSGTLKSEETELAGVAYSVVVFDEIASKTVGTITGEVSSDNFILDSKRLSASWKVQDILKGTLSYENGYAAFEPKDGKRFKYTVTVTGKDTTGLVSKDTRSFTVDRKVPEIKINDITPVAKKETAADGTVSKYIVNGKIKFSTVVTDTNLKNVKVTVTDGTKSETLFEGNSSTIEKEIDTTKYKDENFLTFKVEAEDSAENTAVSSKTDVWVSQQTDMPEIKFTNGKSAEELGGSGWANVTNGQNVFGIENNNSANFTITDDDGLSLVRVTVFDENKKQIGSEGAVSVADAQLQAQPDSENAKESAANPVEYKVSGGSTSYALAYKLPQKAGKYKILIEVFDTGHDTADEANKVWHTTKCENYVLISEGRISISFAEISNNTCQVKANEKTTIKGTVSLSALEKLASIERFASKETTVTEENGESGTKWIKVPDCSSKYPYEADAVETEKITAKAEGGKIVWEDNIPASMIVDGTQHFFYKATDIAGNSAEIELICNGDGNPPEVKSLADYAKWNVSSSVKLSLLAADIKGFEPSGISSVKYSYKKGETVFSGELTRGNRKYAEDGNQSDSGSYYEYSTTVDFEEGTTSIRLTAEDNVGNPNEAGPFEVKVDKNSPENKILSVGENLFKKNTDSVQVSYAFTDVTSGISKIEFCTNRNFKTDDKTYKSVECSGAKDWGTAESLKTIDIPLTNLNDGKYKIYARATDVAGNVSSVEETGSFTVDTTKPSVKITSHTTAGTEKNALNKTVTFSGTVSDSNVENSKLPVLQYYNKGWKDIKISSFSCDGQNWSFEFDSSSSPLDTVKGIVAFQVAFTDKAGNTNLSVTEPKEGYEYRFKIDQDSDRPVLTFSDISDFENSIVSRSSFKGFISDDDGDVKGLWYIDSIKYDSTKLPSANNAGNDVNGWKYVKVAATTGDWEITLENEGKNSFEFCAVDSVGTVFDTRRTSGLSLKAGVNAQTAPQIIKFTYDKTPPVVKLSYAHGTGTSVPSDDKFSNTSSVFGVKEYLYVKAEITENVGLAAENPLVLELGGEKKEMKFSSASSASPYIYKSTGIQIEGMASGSLQIAVTAKDKAGNEGKGIEQITIDTEAPTIKIVSPTTAVSDAITGSVTIKGIAQDNASLISKVEYLIPTIDQVELLKTTGNISTGWKEVGNSGSWEIQFASGAAESPDSILYYVHGDNQSIYAVEKYGSDTENMWKVPIYFRVTDSCGNIGIRTTYKDSNSDNKKELYVLADPDGGKPRVWVNSPEEESTTSGLVTIYGGASDDVSVKCVQIQIDANGDGNFDSEDFDLINSDTGNWVGTDAKLYIGGNASDWWITANGTNSWKRAINTDNIIASADGKMYLRFRVRSYDFEDKTRGWSNPIKVNIDNNAPVIKDLKVVQFGTEVTADSSNVSNLTPITEREYISGMYVSNKMEKANGTFYLVGKISDNMQVKDVIFNKLQTSSSLPSIDLGISDISNNTTSEYNLCIPLKTDSSGQIYYSIKAKDDNTGETSQTIIINIDSTKPGMFTIGGSLSEDIGDKLRLKSLGEKLGTNSGNSTVVNSNSFFTFGDIVSESGSGLAYIVATFERNGSSDGKRIYNPMDSNTKLSLASSESESSSDGKPYICEEGFAIQKVDVERPSEDSIKSSTFAETTTAAFIQKGGLVRIAGTYCLITDFDKTNGTITLSKSVSDKFKTAELIFAQVIDHQIVETPKTDGGVENDDGDGMVETITQTGSSYNWTASIDSLNIPDGPITIHVVAIDNAGNTNYGYVKTKVENNRPRIAKVMLATDLNGNGKFDYDADSAPETGRENETVNNRTADGAEFGEFSFYSAMEAKSTNLKSEVELKSGSFKVIGGLAILPEFVGGNGDIFYMTSTGLKKLVSKSDLTGSTTKFANKDTNPSGVTYADLISEKGGIILGSDDTELQDSMSFTFWDSTEETTPGTDSQWTLLKIPVTLLNSETEKPEPTITPFYWKNSTENSVYIDKGIKGHIELENDLTQAIKDKFNDDSVIKPKVSGKIKIEGTVTDNVRLGSISMEFEDLFDSSTLAEYKAGEWEVSLPAKVKEAGVRFKVNDVSISQKGHEAKYTLVVDTEKLTGVAGKDKKIVITATDWNNNHSVEGTAQTTENAKTAMYRVDVVPYITQIWTGLSETKPNNPSMYARASTGEYVVRGKTSGATYKDSSTEGETITVYGWNLNNSPQLELGSKTISGISIVENTNENVKRGTYGISFVVPDENSDKLTLTVNGIQNLNNINNDDARGSAVENTNSYEGYYNRQPNGDNNNKLTDDVELHIWNFKNAVTPSGAAAKYVHMKVGPYLSSDSARSGRIGFSFRNGAGFFNMPGYMCEDKIGQFEVYIKSSTYNRAHMYSSAGNLTGNWPGKNMTSTSYEGTSGYYVVDVTGNYSGEVTVMFNQQKNENNKSNKYILSSGPGRYVIDSVGAGDSVTNTIIAKTSYASSTFPTLYSQTKIGQNYQGFSYNTFTFDKNGETYGAALCSDTSGTDEMSANFQFFSRGCGESKDSLDFNYNNCLNGRRIENTKNPAGTYDEDRVKSPAMATFVNNGKTYVYMAYWDHLENRIIYRVGSVDGTGPESANSIDLGLQDLCGATGFLGDGDSNKIGSNKDANARRNSTDSTYVGDKGKAYKYVSVLEDFTGVTDAYVSVASLSDGSAVISWYDDRSRSLKAVKITLKEMLSAALNEKSYSPVTISSNGGAYVSVVSDSGNGLHFAYSSNSGSNLYYAYANSSLSEIKEMLVDVNDDVGDNCTIDVARESSSSPWIPTISYRSNVATGTKVAYPVKFDSGKPMAGSTSGGQYTGNWTICTLPTSNKSISDLISVGYNKDWSDGVYKDFEIISETYATTTGKYTICDSSIIGGNGTSNPVIGYGIATGSIEMAQKK